MASAFLRKYELTVGSPEHTIEIAPDDPWITRRGYTRFSEIDAEKWNYLTIPSGERAITINNLQMEAAVKYSLEDTSTNKQDCTIKLYNLSKDNQRFIRKNGSIHLNAGYINPVNIIRDKQEDDGSVTKETEKVALPMIFSGHILKVSTERVGVNIITTILCVDSKLGIEEPKISKTYKGSKKNPLTYLDIINDLVNELVKKGIPKGRIVESIKEDDAANNQVGVVSGIEGLEPNKKAVTGKLPVLLNEITPLGEKIFNSSYIVEGSVSESLKSICNNIGYRFYISLGRSYVEPKSSPLRPTIAVVKVTQDHIKNNIKIESDNENLTKASKDSKDGITVDLFLNGLVSIDKHINISGTLQDGFYKIKTVQHKLNYEGNDWTTTVSARSGG